MPIEKQEFSEVIAVYVSSPVRFLCGPCHEFQATTNLQY